MKNKFFKVIGIAIILLISVYAIFIIEEVIRFNKVLGSKPLVIVMEDTNIEVEKNTVIEEYIGLGYTMEYETYKIQEENSDNIQIVILGGEFKLFGKVMLSAWVQ